MSKHFKHFQSISLLDHDAELRQALQGLLLLGLLTAHQAVDLRTTTRATQAPLSLVMALNAYNASDCFACPSFNMK